MKNEEEEVLNMLELNKWSVKTVDLLVQWQNKSISTMNKDNKHEEEKLLQFVSK